jgi:hypothetical protein
VIQLPRNRGAIPATFRSPLLEQRLERLLDAYYDNAQKVPFNDRRYKSQLQIWKSAKAQLSADSYGKCAYCESPTAVVAYGDVEHFRPKDIYWWLAFTYDNYTFSCQICNQTFKKAKFPVSGKRLKPPTRLPKAKPVGVALSNLATALSASPDTLTDAAVRAALGTEKAHLPHPYLDDPEAVFAWRADDTNREVWLYCA